MEKETVWMPVRGYEDLYEISADGRVRSLERRVVRKDGVEKRYPAKIIAKQKIRGKERVELWKNNSRRTFEINALFINSFCD